MRKSILLTAFLLIAVTGGTALGLNEKNEGRAGQPRAINAGSDKLIQERERMREEYRALRERRFKELKDSEALATGRSSAAVPGWRTGRDGVAVDDAAPTSTDEMTPEKLMPGQTAMVNVFLVVCGVGLSVLLLVRLRRGAALRRRRKGFRPQDGPMTLSLNSIGKRKFGGGANTYQGHLQVTSDSMPPKEPTPEVSR